MARRPRGADREPGLRIALASAGRAVEPSPRVRSRARRRVGCEPPASDGCRVGHAGVDVVRRSLAPCSDRLSALLAARLGRRSARRRCSPASRSSPSSASSCTRRGPRSSMPACSASSRSPLPASAWFSESALVVMAAVGLADSRRGHRPDPASACVRRRGQVPLLHRGRRRRVRGDPRVEGESSPLRGPRAGRRDHGAVDAQPLLRPLDHPSRDTACCRIGWPP